MKLSPINREGLLTLASFNDHANSLILETANRLGEVALKTEISPSHKHALGLLWHMLECEIFFLAACQDRSAEEIEIKNLAVLSERWPLIDQDIQAYIAGLNKGEEETIVAVKIASTLYHFPIWQLFAHTFIHTAHHRGEISILFSQLGNPLPTLDAILYFIESSGQSQIR